jgi:hypothetical protein
LSNAAIFIDLTALGPEFRHPGGAFAAMPAERRMTREAMCDSREKIQEGGFDRR